MSKKRWNEEAEKEQVAADEVVEDLTAVVEAIKEEDRMGVEAYLSSIRIPELSRAGMIAHARVNKCLRLTAQEWDQLFKTY